MEKITSIFKRRPRLIAGIVVILALALPFIVNQVLKQQEVRQHADSAPAISFNFSPANIISPQGSTNIKVGGTFDVQIFMSTQPSEDIGAVQFTLSYDNAKLSAPTMVSQSTGLKIIQNPTTPAGKYTVTMVNVNATPQVTGSTLSIITLRFTALSAGNAQLSLDSGILATAATFNTYVPVNNQTGITNTYTIVDPNQPSPPVSVIPTDGTATPIPTAVITGPVPSDLTPIPSIIVIPPATLTPIANPTPLPTSTPIPTPTIVAGETVVKIAVTLPGIGSRFPGDNNSPVRTTRQVIARVYDANNEEIPSSNGVLTYHPTEGQYLGQIGVAVTSTTSTSYRIKLKVDNSLFKFIPRIITIVPGTPTTVTTPVELVTGDITGPNNTPDNILDLNDYNLLESCYRGQAACTSTVAALADLNEDRKVIHDDVDADIQARGFYTRIGD